MKQILFSLLLSLLLMGCGGESENAALSDKAWAVERGQDKQSVYDFMKSQNLTITDEDSVLIGFKFDGVIWLNENWDMAIVKFNANSQATSVSLMMSHEFPKRKIDDAITCLTTLYGEAKKDTAFFTTWNFGASDGDTKAWLAPDSPRASVNVIWE